MEFLRISHVSMTLFYDAFVQYIHISSGRWLVSQVRVRLAANPSQARMARMLGTT